MWRLRQTVHTSWLLAWASVALLVGVVLARQVDQTFFAPNVWGVTAVTLLQTVLWRRSLYLVPLLLLGGVLLGLWHGSVAGSKLAVYEKLTGHTAVVAGDVREDVDIGKSGELVLRLTNVTINNYAVAGRVWVTLTSDADIKRGDRVTVQGKLTDGFGTFSAAMYRVQLKKLERPEPGDIARRVRDWFADAVRLAIPEPQASLGIGYLVGQRRALPPELSEALQIAGLTHIVVASGYNLTILVRLARRLFVKISKYMAALAASGMVLCFIAITGASPSMSRAGLVAGLSLAAWYYGRTVHPLVLLPFAAGVTVLIDPSFAWGDLGWLLSFAAFAGVMIVAPLGQAYFFGNDPPGIVRQIIGETAAAFVVTLPILLFAFGQMSNVAIVANVLVLPLVPLAMLLTFIAGIGALLVPGVAPLIGLPASWLLHYMVATAQWLAGQPWAQSEVSIGMWQVVGMYAAMAAACMYMQRVTKYSLRTSNIVE